MFKFTGWQKCLLISFLTGSICIYWYLHSLSQSQQDAVEKNQRANDQLTASRLRSFTENLDRERTILRAIADDDAPAVAEFFDEGVVVTSRIARQSIPVIAASKGAVKVMSLLISKGVDINLRDEEGKTLLMHAVREAHPAVAKLLLTHGARVDQRNKNGITALMYAAALRTGDEKAITSNSANTHTRTDVRWTSANLLLGHGADVNAAISNGSTAIAYVGDDMALADLLLAHGVNKNQSLWGATNTMNLDLLRHLLAKGANPNATKVQNETLLHYARKLQAQHAIHAEQAVQALVRAGAAG